MMCGKQFRRSKEQIYPQVKNKTKKGKKYSNRASDLIWECFSELNAEEAICLLHRHKQKKWKCGVKILCNKQYWRSWSTVNEHNSSWKWSIDSWYYLSIAQWWLEHRRLTDSWWCGNDFPKEINNNKSTTKHLWINTVALLGDSLKWPLTAADTICLLHGGG